MRALREAYTRLTDHIEQSDLIVSIEALQFQRADWEVSHPWEHETGKEPPVPSPAEEQVGDCVRQAWQICVADSHAFFPVDTFLATLNEKIEVFCRIHGRNELRTNRGMLPAELARWEAEAQIEAVVVEEGLWRLQFMWPRNLDAPARDWIVWTMSFIHMCYAEILLIEGHRPELWSGYPQPSDDYLQRTTIQTSLQQSVDELKSLGMWESPHPKEGLDYSRFRLSKG